MNERKKAKKELPKDGAVEIKTDYRIAHLKKQLLAGLSNDWTIPEMAEAVNLSAAQLHRICKQTEGVSHRHAF